MISACGYRYLCFQSHAYLASQVNPQFYAFRWITLLLTQEFKFRDCLSLWDTLLGDPEGPQVREPQFLVLCYEIVLQSTLELD